MGHHKKKYDYIIVGAGTAGSVLAKLLSDDGCSVFVLEGGDDHRRDPVVQDPLGALTDSVVPIHWFYPIRASEFQGVPFVVYTEGRMWGGSSGHNYLLAVRGTPDIYDTWASESGNGQWSYVNLLPAMKYLETYTPSGTVANPAQRGSQGPLFITQTPTHPAETFYTLGTILVNAPYKTDYNDPSLGNVMASAPQGYIDPIKNQRSYAATAFLPDTVLDSEGHGVCRNLTVASHAIASEILFDESDCELTAVGVRYYQAPADSKNQQDCTEKVHDVFGHHILLCAGTIEDACLLQRSGIGPASTLGRLGIPIRMANENVGRNVQNHSGPIAVIPSDMANPVTDMGAAVFTDLSGPHGGPVTGIREFQFIVTPSEDNVISMIGFNLRPLHNGTIDIQSSDPTVPPRIALHLSEGIDLDRNVAALKAAADISLGYTGLMPIAPPAEVYPNTFPGGTFSDDTGLQQYILDPSGAGYVFANHNSGSCRMSSSAATGVVDGKLHVFGVQNLSVADNAVAPQIETGNTAWMAYVIGLTKAKIEGVDVLF